MFITLDALSVAVTDTLSAVWTWEKTCSVEYDRLCINSFARLLVVTAVQMSSDLTDISPNVCHCLACTRAPSVCPRKPRPVATHRDNPTIIIYRLLCCLKSGYSDFFLFVVLK